MKRSFAAFFFGSCLALAQHHHDAMLNRHGDREMGFSQDFRHIARTFAAGNFNVHETGVGIARRFGKNNLAVTEPRASASGCRDFFTRSYSRGSVRDFRAVTARERRFGFDYRRHRGRVFFNGAVPGA